MNKKLFKILKNEKKNKIYMKIIIKFQLHKFFKFFIYLRIKRNYW